MGNRDIKAARPRTKAGRAARDQRVAAGIVSGKSTAAIARDEGVSRQTASRLGNSREVQLLVTGLVEGERAKIRGLFTRALDTIAASFEATKTAVYEGAAVELGPDHFARLTGVKRLTEVLTAGRQAQKPEPPPKKTFTLEDLKQALAEAQTDRLQ